MMAEEITILLSARPLARNDLRPLGAVRAIETALPSERMRYEIGDDGSPVTFDDFDARLAAAVKRRDLPLVCNGNAHGLIAISWYRIPAILGPKGKTALSNVMVRLPKSPVLLGATEDLLGRLGDASEAFWGVATPDPSAAVIGAQLAPQNLPPGLRTLAPGGLPSLPPQSQLSGPQIPERLGWIIYLSPKAAEHFGFPDSERDAFWRGVRRTDAGAWLVRLTDEPLLVPDNAEHLALLKAAYVRFRG
jgi:hypothetical protein